MPKPGFTKAHGMKRPRGVLGGKASVFYWNQLSPKLRKLCPASVGISKPYLKYSMAVMSRVMPLVFSPGLQVLFLKVQVEKVMQVCVYLTMYKSISYMFLKLYGLQCISGKNENRRS